MLHDEGDPLLNTAILHWTTTHVPLTDGWWQFPIFYPARDVMAFSEHLLGLSVLATPLEWITGSALAAYNIVALLTFPLCGLSMYALVWHLTRNRSAAFLAGLAFAFAPYRMSQIAHLQMLALFWSPLALLGLHGYVETRKARWLVLYATAWLFQSASNGYYLFFLSFVVALWTVWFVIARCDWQALRRITVATAGAAIPIAVVLAKYVVVHHRNGFIRTLDDLHNFSADALSVVCAPGPLTLWHGLRVYCGNPESEIFPGLALFIICAFGGGLLLVGRATRFPKPGMPRTVVYGSLGVATIFFAAAATVLAFGPWNLRWGLVHVAAPSVGPPLGQGTLCVMVGAIAWWPYRRMPRELSTLVFYMWAAFACWLMTLGPDVMLAGKPVGVHGPFRLFMMLPGVDSLRVPARFWGLSSMCLAVVAGLIFAEWFRQPTTRSRLALVLCAIALLSDGWVNVLRREPIPIPSPLDGVLRDLNGEVMMRLPAGDVRDMRAAYEASLNALHTVNGYTGYQPSWYPAWQYAVRFEDDEAFAPFRETTGLTVAVDRSAPRLVSLVERQRGASSIVTAGDIAYYSLPRSQSSSVVPSETSRLTIRKLAGNCMAMNLGRALDSELQTAWTCEPMTDETVLEADLGRPLQVGTVVSRIPADGFDFPTHLDLETSVDQRVWEPAFSGSTVGLTIRGAFAAPASPRIILAFQPRVARYVRIRHPGGREHTWSISELEAWSSSAPP